MLTHENDMFYHILLEALNSIDAQIGHSHITITKEELAQFDPNIIIHNSDSFDKVEYKDAVSIAINEMDSPHSFSYKRVDSENFIKPFVKVDNKDLKDDRYKSDIVYVGNPSLLPDCVAKFQLGGEFNFKIINNTPIPITNYCGSCTFENYKKFFHMSKCSLVNKSDSDLDFLSFKLLDILQSGGNPITHKDDDQFVKDVEDALGGKSFRGDFPSKQEIEDKYTNFERMSEILSKVGLNKLSKMVLESKGQ